ncbi:dipeptidase [Bacillus thermotolerans]|mgnify:CR=1 FL=1|uniref:Microsomal dipeptidase n=1 Tax=Bacillus thermotolerans TaxID=1221996 RepID=A0A0F5I1A5_BACTR|nr:dipeptidase [Bacillus thermotolerans]KKB38902.1 Microsomal dipeptidase [Bacillus thermotolerans]KKB42431.1 Microsomal dipeptidase [Bacillus thermotolerans]
MIFDAHCDVLYQLQQDRHKTFEDPSLHVTYTRLKQANAKIQCFAIFLSPSTKPHDRFRAALEQVELFYEKIIRPYPDMKAVTSREEMNDLKEGEIGAVLTLEGCEAIEEDPLKLTTLLRLGVKSIGLTWNNSNALADGVMTKRGGGLTEFGNEVVQLLNKWNVWTDVSHLSEKAFWDVIALADAPIASHSNSYRLCAHPRNLKDDQIRALIQKDSVIGLSFVPFFVKEEGTATMTDLLRHVDHICGLGGEDHIGFGSDFDGIEETIDGLSSYELYTAWAEELAKHFSARQVEKFLWGNFSRRFPAP